LPWSSFSQFSRHILPRCGLGNPGVAPEYDTAARKLANWVFAEGLHRELAHYERMFLNMPFIQSEAPTRCLQLSQQPSVFVVHHVPASLTTSPDSQLVGPPQDLADQERAVHLTAESHEISVAQGKRRPGRSPGLGWVEARRDVVYLLLPYMDIITIYGHITLDSTPRGEEGCRQAVREASLPEQAARARVHSRRTCLPPLLGPWHGLSGDRSCLAAPGSYQLTEFGSRQDLTAFTKKAPSSGVAGF